MIDARVQSLQTQGEIIAAAIAASATVETDTITIDPEKLLQLAPGQSSGAGAERRRRSLEFSINPERVGPVLRRLVTPTRTRARIFDQRRPLLLDSRPSAARRDHPLRSSRRDERARPRRALLGRRSQRCSGGAKTAHPTIVDRQCASSFPEVAGALQGSTQSRRAGQRRGRDDRLRRRADPAHDGRRAARFCSRRKAATSTT